MSMRLFSPNFLFSFYELLQLLIPPVASVSTSNCQLTRLLCHLPAILNWQMFPLLVLGYTIHVNVSLYVKYLLKRKGVNRVFSFFSSFFDRLRHPVDDCEHHRIASSTCDEEV